MENIKVVKGLIIFAITFALCYLVGAFANADFNILHWQEDLRQSIALIGGFCSIAATVFYIGFSDEA